MPSADLLLRLLEQKDLVSPEVLQAARAEIQRSSPPPDAVHVCLWLVQSHHITAAQADRLLAAAKENEAPPTPEPPQWRGGRPLQAAATKNDAAAPSRATERFGARSVPATPTDKTKSPAPPAAARSPASAPPDAKPVAGDADDFELAPLEEEPKKNSARKPDAISPAITAPAKASGPQEAPANNQGKKAAVEPKIGGLEPLASTMKGPLDALIESEALQSAPFDDPLTAGQLAPAGPKKFKLRRFLKNLFRRKKKSKTVTVKAADPRQVKLVLFSWGLGVSLLLVALVLFYIFSPPAPTELRAKAEDAMAAEDFPRAVQLYNEFLNRYPNAPVAADIHLLRGIVELRLAEKQATASGDWRPAVKSATAQVKGVTMKGADPDLIRKFAVALARIGEGLSQQANGHPDPASIGRLQSIVNILENDIPENCRPTKMIDEISGVLRQGKQQVEGRQELDQAIEAIRAAVQSKDVRAAYDVYRELAKSSPDLADDARLTEAMKQVSAVQQEAVKLVSQPLAAVRDTRPSDLVAAMPLAVQPLKGDLAASHGKLQFIVHEGTAYGLDAAAGKVLWRRFLAADRGASPTALPLPAALAVDVVLCDPVHQELLRLDGATGKLLWRLAVGQPILAEPVLADKWLLVLTKDHGLRLIDAATGNSASVVKLPQTVRLRPTVDAADGLIILIADQSNIIALDNGQIGHCRQVLHLGHEAGRIVAPPAVSGGFLFVPINDTSGGATVRRDRHFQGQGRRTASGRADHPPGRKCRDRADGRRWRGGARHRRWQRGPPGTQRGGQSVAIPRSGFPGSFAQGKGSSFRRVQR